MTDIETPRTLDLFVVLGEPNRRRLLELLRGGEMTVTELAAHFTVTRPAISQHLGVLASAGLVEVRRDGRFRRYRVRPDGMAALRSSLDAFWTSELEDLASGRPATGTDTGTDTSTETKGTHDDD
ncbi:MAG TPA: metalloregulator ArsR/SmtB family transcription factor [Acidimicrobiales bacterium]